MLPVLQVGPVALQTAPLVLILGFWIALEVAARQAPARGLEGAAIPSAGFLGAVGGVLAARLAYALQFWPVYRDNLLGILSPSLEALSPVPGVLVGLALAAGYLGHKRLPLRPLLDALAPGLAVFVIAIALGSFLDGTSYGVETNLPWAINLWDESRHPVQLYHLLGSLVILGLLLGIGLKVPAPGLGFLLFVALYGALRLLIEPFRADTLFIGGWRAAQVAGLFALLGSLWLMRVWHRASTPSPSAALGDKTND
jgi:phosphatidylglycerol:prolipoprotein diacylglycerol transferase